MANPMYSGLMPGEWDALQEAMRRTGSPLGLPSANPAGAIRGGILGTLDERLKPFGGLLGVGANLLSQSGQTGSFGGALGNALLQGQQRVSEAEQNKLRNEFMQAQIDAMRAPKRPETPTSVQEYEYAKQNGYTGSYDQWKNAGAGAKPTSDIQEYEYAKAQGYKGSYLDFLTSVRRAGASSVSVNTGEMPKPPPGYYRPDPTKPGLNVEPGSPAEREIADAERKRRERESAAAAQAGGVIQTVDSALAKLSPLTVGVGGVLMRNVPGSKAVDLSGELETIKANLGFDRIQQMREQSPTGGALGSVAVQELNALQSTVASLDQKQSPTQLRESLRKIRKHYEKWQNVVNASRGSRGFVERMVPAGQAPAANVGGADDPLGLR